mmetsp:Transcript_4691/g.9468  ORF Transcript_4691/g.9468 Transcript_4691/m.9468 type:complete len:90 (+) Transcript_4691:1612-1881(+)
MRQEWDHIELFQRPTAPVKSVAAPFIAQPICESSLTKHLPSRHTSRSALSIAKTVPARHPERFEETTRADDRRRSLSLHRESRIPSHER